ncbi:MAG TPA: hypothetical protein VLT86_15425 [Vicinamibacterales bacterium]|nr:hypothetical protein [Vicinamibacterales bacterium]
MSTRPFWRRNALAALALAASWSIVGSAFQRGGGAPAGPQVTQSVPELRFRYVGPQSAGRVASVAGVPGDPTTYYLGAASGGVWKSTDSGQTWAPIFDDMPVQAIGSLAVAPSDPNQVWAGTGEAWVIRDSDIGGDGIYKSTDAGKTWKNVGLPEAGRIGRIIVHPTNPNVVYACVIGRVTAPQQERGVYKTSDGGATWERSLFVNPDTGCSGISMDPNNPDTLIAGMWQVALHTWAMYSGMWPGYTGTPGSGVYLTHDGGKTWKKAETGMPRPPVGKIDVAIAPSNAQRMYALIQTANQGSLWRSEDGGATWKTVSWDRTLIGRAGYYISMKVNPQNPDDVFILNSGFHRSSDGGATFGGGGGGGGGCGDCHDVWIDPKDGRRFVLTDDGGARITSPTGSQSVSLPIGQMYHVGTDDRMPYWVYSNRQDDGTMRGPSNSPVTVANVPSYVARSAVPGAGGGAGFGGGRGRGGGGAAGGAGARGGAAPAAGAGAARGAGAPSGTAADTGTIAPPDAGVQPGGGGRGGRGGATSTWQPGIGGCESGFTLPVPRNPDVVWASCYGDEVTRFDANVGRARSVAPWIHTLDSEPPFLKYRCHWTPPLVLDPFDEETVYYGCNVIFKTSDKGQTWQVISPDLSTQDPAHIVSSGGIIGDNLGQFYGELVFAIAPSPIQKGLIWAGTNDGKLWYTRNGGGAWTDVTKNITGITPLGTVTQISPSNFDPGTTYVAIDTHLVDDRKPYLYKTNDFGATWTKISGALPQTHPLDYTKSIAENPNKKGMLFAGTAHGFYYSMNDGATWTNLQTDLPRAPVTWITVQKTYHDVVISTYGRGLWVMDDITRLEETGQASPAATETKLYPPRAMREARSGEAKITFSLASAPAAPVKFEILDSANQVIRTFDAQAHAGLNIATWDLRYEPPGVVELRTTPPDNPHIWEGNRFRGETRPVNHWGIQGAQRAAPMAAPGKYTARMTVAGMTYAQPFTVIKDMMIPSSDADLVESTKAQVRVRNALDETSKLTNRVEILRKQIEDLLKANRGKDELEKPLMDLDKKMLDVELIMLSEHDFYSDDKWYVEHYHLYQNLIWLNGVIGFGAGDVAGGAEYRPTAAAMQWLSDLEKELARARVGVDKLEKTDVPAFNQAMAGKLPAIK